jgi:clan AA aspartic protease (TIGR02281 family)
MNLMGRLFRAGAKLLLGLVGAMSLLLVQPGTPAHAGPFEDGVDFFQGGHYRWALEKFIEAVDGAPRDPERKWYLAESYRLLGDNAAAAQAYRGILQMAPQSPQATAARRALDAMGEPSLTTFQVPFERRGPAVLVPGKVNGQPIGYFILDTGATFTSVSRLVADRLGVSSSGSTVRLATASGVIQAPLALLDEVEVGGAVARHVPAVIHDLPNAPPAIVGLLGLSFLERFRVNLNLTSGILILEAGE